jgi:hypothetical protein
METTTEKNKCNRDFEMYFVFTGEKKTACSENWTAGMMKQCVFRFPADVDAVHPMFNERLVSIARHYLQTSYGDDTMFFIYHDEEQARQKRNELKGWK